MVRGTNDATVAYALTALFGVLATMVLMIIPEAVGRTGAADRRRRPKRLWLHPVRWVRRTLAPLSRSWEVLAVARRNGLARPQFLSARGMATAEFGRRLRLTLEEVGGMFVKFGQIASTRSDLLSDPVIDELSASALGGAAHPADQVRPLVEAELGRRVEEAFASFDFEPLAVGLHRPGPPGHPDRRRGGGGQDPAARARRPAPPGRHGAAAGRPDGRAPDPGARDLGSATWPRS